MITDAATPKSVETYGEPIQCPSFWTPEHRMIAVRVISEMIYQGGADERGLFLKIRLAGRLALELG